MWKRVTDGGRVGAVTVSGARTVVGMTSLVQLWPQSTGGLVELPAGTDVWQLHADGLWLVVPTNCRRKGDGTAVMGAGLALDAARRFPDLPVRYGRALAAGNRRVVIAEHRLLLAPTKDDWRRPAVLELVTELLDGVARWCAANPQHAVAVASPGCGRGGLAWPVVHELALARLAGHRVALLPPLPAAPRHP